MRRRERLRRNLKLASQHRSLPMQFVDIVVHKVKLNTHWEDYYRFGFYRRDIPWETRELYVGYFGSKYWPWETNSLKFDRLFVLKSLQKSILLAHGVATPRLLAKAGAPYRINTPEKFAREMRKFDQPVVAKFDGGGSGVRIFCLKPDNGRFRCGDAVVDSDWIWNQYEPVIDKGFIVEEQVVNHPVMAKIYSRSLNTLRMTTTKTADGKWHLLLPYVKFGRGGSQVDNISAGGLFAAIDDSGMVGPVHSSKTPDIFGQHPDTGAKITGMEIPFFEEAKELALTASLSVGFMGSIAWDVGITPDGPVIIEGNPHWDPQGIQDRLGPFLTPTVAAGLAPRWAWTPWDKSHMYPRYMNYADGGPIQRYMARRRERFNDKFRGGE